MRQRGVFCRPPHQVPALRWLQANRQGWGIENGTHQRPDVSLNDDRRRVRSTNQLPVTSNQLSVASNGLWILGMMRRVVISFFMEWRPRQPKPHFQSLRGLQAEMGEDNPAKALRFVTCQRPTL